MATPRMVARPPWSETPPEHTGRNHVQLETLSGVWLTAGDPGSQNHPGQCCHRALDQENDHPVVLNIDPRKTGGFRITSNGQRVATINGFVQQDAKADKTDHRDPNRQ